MKAERIASEILNELQTKSGGAYANIFRIELVDKDGFLIAKTSTREMSGSGLDGQLTVPTVDNWIYRGVIDINESESARISGYNLVPIFDNKMDVITADAINFLMKKKAERMKKKRAETSLNK